MPKQQLQARYCASWCGYGCTKAMHDAALKTARDLARTLGQGWTPEVWENMGWHSVAISECGRVKVHPHTHNGKTSYTSFLGTPGPGGKWTAQAPTPQEAVRRVIAKAMEDLGVIATLTIDLPSIGKPKRALRTAG